MSFITFRAALVAAIVVTFISSTTHAQDTQADTAAMLRQMQQQLDEMRRQMAERDRQIEALRQEVRALNPPPPPPPPPPEVKAQPVHEHEKHTTHAAHAPHADSHTTSLLEASTGPASVRLLHASVNLLVAAGGSTASNEELEALQGGGHDPRRRGFTLQNAELSLLGAVDPYFNGEAHIIYFIDPIEGETVVELEEAFLTTQSLPWNLEARAGQFFTPFGLINPKHPHEWDWLDIPVINARVFGPDGMRGVGAQLAWLAPLPWESRLIGGIQNAEGETMASFNANDEFFEERPVAGRPPGSGSEVESLADLVYFARLANRFALSEEWTLGLGASGAWGPNATGPDGDTRIYGGDVLVRWQPPGSDLHQGHVTWQTEYIRRDYDAAPGIVAGGDGEFGTIDDILIPADELMDWGITTQVLYGFAREWALGLRYEYAASEGDSVDADGNFIDPDDDPSGFRGERHRLSPMLVWQPSEFSRVRLQYSFDRAEFLEDGEAHSVWLGFEVLFGAHAEHEH